jgi:predicted ABC-class ATPase
MLPADRLRDKLIVMNGKGVQVYRELAGAYRFDRFELYLDSLDLDPSAPSCAARIRIDQAEAQVPSPLWESPAGRIAVQDFLARAVRDAIHKHVRTRWSGRIMPLVIDAGEQAILPRTCCTMAEDYVEVQFTAALPAEGRKVLARPAQALFFTDLPAVVNASLVWAQLDAAAGRRHCETLEDYLALRDALDDTGLAAFVADGSVLPREPGPGDRPLRGSRFLPLRAPDELAVTITLPHRGPVRGLGVRRGVTVIAGGAFSGKSSLLAAIGSGICPHAPGDGRELVAAVPDAVTIRAEAGRRIERVDVSAFIHRFPHRPDVRALSVERTTGMLSMAAAVAEALEVGTHLLLFDEDDGAIMFLARDAAMRSLIPETTESITPLVDRVRALWEVHGISSVIATGGLGEYLDVADTVIIMEGFQPLAATERARSLAVGTGARENPENRPAGGPPTPPLNLPVARCPLPRGFSGMRGRGLRAELRGRETLAIGRDTVDLKPLIHLADGGQARAAGDAILYALEKAYIDGNTTMAGLLDRIFSDIEASGLGVLVPPQGRPGDYATPRRQEVAAILNRLRSLQVRPQRGAEPILPPTAGEPAAEGPAAEEPAAGEPAEGSEREFSRDVISSLPAGPEPSPPPDPDAR